MGISSHNLKLALSIATNFAAKAPSVLSVILILPLVRHSLGIESFNDLLAAFALAGVFAAPFGGIGVLGRRLIGEGVAAESPQREADAVISQIFLAIFVTLLAGTGIFLATDIRGAPYKYVIVGLIALSGMLLNTFDNVRGAYNEHYITASMQFIFQVSAFAAAMTIPYMTHGPVIAAFTLQGPMALASLATGVLLFNQRRYLLRGRANLMDTIAKKALLIAVADGALMASLNFSVVWISSHTDSPAGAWYGSLIRLFQTVLTPVLLLLFPVASYLNLRWHSFSNERKNLVLSVLAVFSLGYGATVAFAMAGIGYLYLPKYMSLNPPIDLLNACAIFLFLGAIVAQKAYSSVAFLIFDGDKFSRTSSLIVLGGLFAAFVASLFFAPFITLSIFSVSIGGPLMGAIALNVLQMRRSLKSHI